MNTKFKVGDKIRNILDHNIVGTIEMLTNNGFNAYVRIKKFRVYVELSFYEKVEEEAISE